MNTHVNKELELLVIAGEASADEHAAQILAVLNKTCPKLRAYGIGGRAMRAEGFESVARAEDIAIGGLTEVVWAIPRILGIMGRMAKIAEKRRPQVALLLDLPDFNLRLAKKLKAIGIPVVYYISPQLWAWRPGRVELIRRFVDHMLVILPFEADFYQEHGVSAKFVGHPLLEKVPVSLPQDAARRSLGLPDAQEVIALLPGSRKKEMQRHLPRMLQALRLLRNERPGLHAVLPIASTLRRAPIEQMILDARLDQIRLVDEHANEALAASDAAIVCSGTATLQTALLERPMVVVYRVSWLTYQILKRLISLSHIALANLVAQKAIAEELVQGDFTALGLKNALTRLLDSADLRRRQQQDMSELRAKLGASVAAEAVAECLMTYAPSPEDAAKQEPKELAS